VHRQNCYHALNYVEGSLPTTERIAREIISLPMFPGLTANQQARVAAAIESFMSVSAR
jgi:dTDP-4-amino-4,6-dideoxygalactose transaminase